MLIARLTAQLRCYVPEPVDETWARLRHLGARREQLITEVGSQVQQMRDLLECVWPAALDTARQPFRSRTWIAALSRDRRPRPRRLRPHPTPRPGPVRAGGPARDHSAGAGRNRRLRILRRLFAALADPAGVTAHRAGALERVQLLLADWHARPSSASPRPRPG